MTMRTTIELEEDYATTRAMTEAVRLMPSHAIDALERNGYRIIGIETDGGPIQKVTKTQWTYEVE